jgi:hypothetical protein
MNARISSATVILVAFVNGSGCSGKVRESASVYREAAQDEDPKAAPAQGGVALNGRQQEVQRKIIQTATLDVLVSDFDKARADLAKLIEDYKGYISKSEFNGNVGSKRSGTWTIRVPAEWFQPFVGELVGLGQPQKHATDAQDVTEEYVDLQAIIANLKEKEAKLNELMKTKAQSLADMIVWEKEISEVRGQIGRAEARLQTLSRLTAMSTVHITLRDVKEFVPPTNPAYGTSISRTFHDSVDALVDFGRWVIVILAALAPWSPAIIFIVALVWMRVRRIKRDLRLAALATADSEAEGSPRDT